MTEDDIKSITKLSANYWQWWFNKGMVTFQAPKESKSPVEDSELSASGSRISGQNALSQMHRSHENKSVHSGDGYYGLQIDTLTQSPAKLIKESPMGSVHS